MSDHVSPYLLQEWPGLSVEIKKALCRAWIRLLEMTLATLEEKPVDPAAIWGQQAWIATLLHELEIEKQKEKAG